MSDLNPYEEGLALELQEAKGLIKALQKALKDQSSVSDRLAEKLHEVENLLAKAVKSAFEEGFLAAAADGWVNNPRIKMEWNRSQSRATLSQIKGEIP